MDTHLFLTPKQPPNRGHHGVMPHLTYRLLRAQAEEIIKARDLYGWSDRRAAKELHFRSAKEFARAYELLKDNGRRIVERGDWSGVEAVIYAKFAAYRTAPKFREILAEFNDPRVRTNYPEPAPPRL